MIAPRPSMAVSDPVGWLGAVLEVDRRRFSGLDVTLARRIAEEFARLHQRVDILAASAAQDEGTHAVTRWAGWEAIEREVTRAQRHGHTLGIAFLAVVAPDAVTEDAGDDLMVPLVELLHESLRRYDHIIRWNEQEFVCMLPGSDLRGVTRIMDEVAVEFARRTLTCFTCGVALLQPDDTPDSVVARAEKAMAAARASAKRRTADSACDRGRLILLVEDDVAIRDMYQLGLMQAGYRTAVAGDGEQALRRAAELAPDLILLDVGLPVLNGEEVLCRLRADPRLAHIPVAVLSSRADDERLMARMRALGAVGCFVKSQLTPRALVDAIPTWLAGRGSAMISPNTEPIRRAQVQKLDSTAKRRRRADRRLAGG